MTMAVSAPAMITLLLLCVGAAEVAAQGVWGKLVPTSNRGEKIFAEFRTDAACTGAVDAVQSQLSFSYPVAAKVTTFEVQKAAACTGSGYSLSGAATVTMTNGLSMAAGNFAVNLQVGPGSPGSLTADWGTPQVALTVSSGDVAAIETAALADWTTAFASNKEKGLQLASAKVTAGKTWVSAEAAKAEADHKAAIAVAALTEARAKVAAKQAECVSYAKRCSPFNVNFCVRAQHCVALLEMLAADAERANQVANAARGAASLAAGAVASASAAKGAVDAAYTAYQNSLETRVVAAYDSAADLLSLQSVSVALNVGRPSCEVTVTGKMLGAAFSEMYVVPPSVSDVAGAVAGTLNAALETQFA